MDWSVRDHAMGKGGAELGGKRVFLQYSPYGCFRGLFLLEELVGAFHGLVEFEAELAVFLPVVMMTALLAHVARRRPLFPKNAVLVRFIVSFVTSAGGAMFCRHCKL